MSENETPPTVREAVVVIMAQAEAITAAERAMLDLLARIAALEAERDAMQRRAEMAEDDMLSAGRACDDLAARVTELEAERDAARAEAGRLRGLLVWIQDEAAMYSDDGRAGTSRRIRAALAGSGERQP